MMTPRPLSRVRGVVILYATIAVGMLGVLGSTMSDGSQATVDAVQASVYTQMARYAAESGIETGIAALDSHLAMDCTTFEPDPGNPGGFRFLNSPNKNPSCDGYRFNPCVFTDGGRFTIAWSGDGSENLCANSAPKGLLQMHPPGWENPSPGLSASGPEADRERIAQRYVGSFQLSITPPFNSFNVVRRLKQGSDAVFALRARGMIRGGADPANPGGRVLIGHAVLVAKIRVGPQPCNKGHGRIERLSMDLVTANNYQRAGPAYTWPASESGSGMPSVALPH